MSDAVNDNVLIIDFGSQVTQLIARRLREAGVYTEILPCTVDPAQITAAVPRGIILSGGPNSVAMADTPRAPQAVFDLGVPVLGICYGQQTMCQQLGGRVEPGTSREFGRATLDIIDECLLFDGLWPVGGSRTVWMSHGDHVAALPPGFRVVATSAGAPYAAVADDDRRLYGV
ncbi:MAG: glutamine-hydrolyzing GMP synthase, partial [Candidatus Puniceispirillaceae bacterium]